MILVGNKIDLIKDKKVSNEDIQKVIKDFGFDLYLETSAKTGENVQKLFVEASKILYEDYLSFKRNNNINKIKSNETNKKIKFDNEENAKETKGCIC